MTKSRRFVTEPLLTGADAAAAARALRAIGTLLVDAPHVPSSKPAHLLDTLVARAAFFAERAHLEAADEDRSRAQSLAREAIELAADATEEEIGSLPLFGGLVGLGWLLKYLRGRGHDVPTNATAEVDALLARMIPVVDDRAYDVVGGLCGAGIYLLEGPVGAQERELVVAIVQRLVNAARPREVGRSWRAFPGGYHRGEGEADNLGLAHGIPGPIALLAAAVERGLASDDARALLRDATAWLWANEQRSFPHRRYAFSAREPERRARLGWCYGDPGVAVSLYLSARAIGGDDERARALELVRSARACPAEDSGVDNLTVCHGSAGLAHVLHVVGRDAGDAGLLEGARRWFRALSRHELTSPELPTEEGPGTTILEGLPGVGLTLISALSSKPPRWDGPIVVGLIRR